MSALIWVHDEAMGAQHPAYAQSGTRVFVFDPARVREEGWGLNRLIFMAEAAQDLGATVYRGDTVATLTATARDAGLNHIVFAETPHPPIVRRAEALAEAFSVQAIGVPSHGEPGPRADLKRFSRYWRRARADFFER
ncbi:MAG: hypothetical protein ACFB2Z_02760 [Maricaulaceae bacterium]